MTADRDAWSLVERAQAGDMDTFADLYRQHRTAVHRYISSRLGPELADDMTQDVFAKAIRYIGSVKFTGQSPIAWIMTITRNEVIDYTRCGRYKHRARFGGTIDGFDRPDTGPGPEWAAEQSSLRRVVRDALAQLRPTHRRVLTLRFLEGMDTYETAAAMGLTVPQAKALQFRATRALAVLIPREAVEAAA